MLGLCLVASVSLLPRPYFHDLLAEYLANIFPSEGELIGFSARIVAYGYSGSLVVYIIQISFLVIAPALFAASVFVLPSVERKTLADRNKQIHDSLSSYTFPRCTR